MTDRPTLTPKHQQTLIGSAIDPEVALERGYRSVTPSDPQLQAFAGYQRADGILIPVRPPDGSNGRYQLRRNQDRIRKDGSTAKYEEPAGGEHRLDVHPRFHDKLADPSVPAWIGEGIKKGDALASRGQLCISLGGVECGLTPACLEDWQHIAIAGRTFLICFDHDPKPVTRQNVGRAQDKIAAFLTERGGRVRIVELPPGPNGEKQGIDDFLANGGNLVALVAEHCQDWRPPTEGDCPREDCQGARRELAEERKRAVAEAQILTGPGIRPNRRVPYYLLVNRLRSDATRARHPEAEPGKPETWKAETPLADSQGYIGINLQGMAKDTGVSYATLLKARSELIEQGVFEDKAVYDQLPDGKRITRTLLRPVAASPLEMVHKLATVVQAPTGWGGKRAWRCPDHHEAKVELKHVCAACGRDAELVEITDFQVDNRSGDVSSLAPHIYGVQLENRSGIAPAVPPARVLLAGARPPDAVLQRRLQQEARADIERLVERRTAAAFKDEPAASPTDFQHEKRTLEADGELTNPDPTQRRCADCGALTRNAEQPFCGGCRLKRAESSRPAELPLGVPLSPEADIGLDPPADGSRSPWLTQFLMQGAGLRWQSYVVCGLHIRQGQKHWEAFAREHADKLPRVVEELRRLQDVGQGLEL